MRMALLLFPIARRSIPVPNIGSLVFLRRKSRKKFRLFFALASLVITCNPGIGCAYAAGQTPTIKASTLTELDDVVSFIRNKNSQINSYSRIGGLEWSGADIKQTRRGCSHKTNLIFKNSRRKTRSLPFLIGGIRGHNVRV